MDCWLVIENLLESFVIVDDSFVLRVLEILSFDINPKLAYYL
mgnify:FL=1